jgi:hypothetical protein
MKARAKIVTITELKFYARKILVSQIIRSDYHFSVSQKNYFYLNHLLLKRNSRAKWSSCLFVTQEVHSFLPFPFSFVESKQMPRQNSCLHVSKKDLQKNAPLFVNSDIIVNNLDVKKHTPPKRIKQEVPQNINDNIVCPFALTLTMCLIELRKKNQAWMVPPLKKS